MADNTGGGYGSGVDGSQQKSAEMLCIDRFFIFPDIVRLSVVAVSSDAAGLRTAYGSSEYDCRIRGAGGWHPAVLHTDPPKSRSDRKKPVCPSDDPLFHLSDPVRPERVSGRNDRLRASAEPVLRSDRRLLSVCAQPVRRCLAQGPDLRLWLCCLRPDDLGPLPGRRRQFHQIFLGASSLRALCRPVRMAGHASHSKEHGRGKYIFKEGRRDGPWQPRRDGIRKYRKLCRLRQKSEKRTSRLRLKARQEGLVPHRLHPLSDLSCQESRIRISFRGCSFRHQYRAVPPGLCRRPDLRRASQ